MTDDKPAKPYKNPALLNDLKTVWRRNGCAVCGAMPTGAELGYDIELHHLDKQGRPDLPWLVIGLCGAFLNRCHADAEQHHLAFRMSTPPELYGLDLPDFPTAWVDRRPGGNVWTAVSFPYLEVAALAERHGCLTPPVPSGGSAGVEVEQRLLPPGPSGGETAAPNPAEARVAAIRELVVHSETSRILIAVNLFEAWQKGEYEQLGMTWAEYLDAVGVSRSAGSKMLTAAKTLGTQRLIESLEKYPKQMSLERAYQGARAVNHGHLSHDGAIEYVASHPVYEIVALLKGETDEPERHACPICGQVHVVRKQGERDWES